MPAADETAVQLPTKALTASGAVEHMDDDEEDGVQGEEDTNAP